MILNKMQNFNLKIKSVNFSLFYLPAVLYVVGVVGVIAFPAAQILLGLFLMPWVYFFNDYIGSAPYIVSFLIFNFLFLLLLGILVEKFSKGPLRKAFQIIFLLIAFGFMFWLLNLALIVLMSIFLK